MKLYALMQSERGKQVNKSGNNWLDIEVRDEDRQPIALILFKVLEDGRMYLELTDYIKRPWQVYQSQRKKINGN
jgi:hypothetical protein